MITRVEALNYRCLRYVDRPINGLNVLVGPNASGKTTFIDVLAFMSDLVRDGLEAALESRSRNWQDLLWKRGGAQFQLAIETQIPDQLLAKLGNPDHRYARYEVGIGSINGRSEVGISHERFSLREKVNTDPRDVAPIFPSMREAPLELWAKDRKGKRNVVSKVADGNDNYNSETTEEGGKGWVPSFRFGPFKSALANLPADESRFPVAVWFRQLLSAGVQKLVLNSQLIRQACPPGRQPHFRPDGSNLPWVVEDLQETHPERFNEWIAHLQTALPDLRSVRTVLREDDKHRYLVLQYQSVGEVPSWMVSDGTLRLLALTLLAYLPDFRGVYLIEEPENGIHPRAIETMYQSLSSVYDAQVLVATHSPVILSIVPIKSVLCFAKTTEGATDIVSGEEHPRLREWRGATNLGTLFAAGVLDHS
jgi:predicted ATPase